MGWGIIDFWVPRFKIYDLFPNGQTDKGENEIRQMS